MDQLSWHAAHSVSAGLDRMHDDMMYLSIYSSFLAETVNNNYCVISWWIGEAV
jgi:hypothetical protein